MKNVSGIADIAKWRNEMTMEMTMEETCRITERAESLVAESHNLIATATLLVREARQLLGQTNSRYVKSKRALGILR